MALFVLPIFYNILLDYKKVEILFFLTEKNKFIFTMSIQDDYENGRKK